ncbi:MAG: MBL fold metallo-hydrolase [Bryobacterales bacterium]|nr:MBL fold metallo-hydrolase [Bryobacteraceae bacterium]MDW8354262.1 MBL fold metallo-hydrolase [Bryobacterales bacterium]
MMRAILALCLAAWVGQAQNAGKLDIYFIDVEGGQATLIVTPAGESMLVDAGWAGVGGRDAERIASVAKSAGVGELDYLLITHYHLDHVGGAPEVVELLPVKTFVDHGPSVETGARAAELFARYERVRQKGRHSIVRPGETIPLRGVEVRIVASGGEVLRAPLAGAGQENPLCRDEKRRDDDPSENAASIGFLLSYGKFRFLNLGDLTWNKELDLVCPSNRIGTVDVYLTTHHGMNTSGPAALVHAVRPRVAVMNNGARKGGTPEALKVLRSSPGLEDIWQLHYSIAAGQQLNAPEAFIANLEENCLGDWLKLSASPDGSFTVRNGRTGYSKSYGPR